MSDKLPEGWTTALLAEIAEINPRHPKGLDDTTVVTFVPMAGVSVSKPDFQFTQDRPLGEVRKGFVPFAEGDVLFAKITPCMENGKGAVARGLRNNLGYGTTELHVIRPLAGIQPEYIYRFLSQDRVRRAAKENFTGTAGQARVPVSFIRELEIPLAPAGEQRRIVAKLENLLANVDACQQRLAKIPVLLKRFRQSVLATACSGRLTADWRLEERDLESATDFVRRIQAERKAAYEYECVNAAGKGQRKPKRPKNEFVAEIDEDAHGLPDRWCVARIGDISDCLDHVRVPINKTERLTRKGAIPYYGANGQVGWIDEFLFDEDLVLVVEDETFIGREIPFSYIIRGKAWVNNHAHVLRQLSQMPVEYLNICLSYYNFTPLTSGTTGRRKLNQEALMDAPLWLAPLPEQQEIVRRVESLFARAGHIEGSYAKAKAYVDKLRPSLLAKAFRGELVPQDPEDEPAGKLLERISHQRHPVQRKHY